MENKIYNTLMDMMGDWHDIIVEMKRYYAEYYYKIIIDNELFYTIHEDMLSEEYFNYSMQNIVYLYGSDTGMKVKRSDNMISRKDEDFDKIFKIEQIINMKSKLEREHGGFVLRPCAEEKLRMISKVLKGE